ncbi:hypothetical protein GmRootV213_24970 [Variovorax sp. V213]
MHVKNKSIIVTGAGAGGGIGEGIAKRLAAEAAQVLVNDINAAAGQQVVEAILRDALYLASDEAAFISRVCIEVDGARCV